MGFKRDFGCLNLGHFSHPCQISLGAIATGQLLVPWIEKEAVLTKRHLLGGRGCRDN